MRNAVLGCVAIAMVLQGCVDVTAARLVAARGPVQALADVTTAAHPGLARFLPRLAQLDAERDVDVAARLGARVVCPGDEDLAERPRPPRLPALLPVGPRGGGPGRTLRPVSGRGGRRSATAYGEMVATEWRPVWGACLRTVVPRRVRIDVAAHRGALATGAGHPGRARRRGWTVPTRPRMRG